MKKTMSALCRLLAMCLLLLCAVSVQAEEEDSSQQPPEVSAVAAYVANLDTNLVVYEKNSTEPLSAASLTKMMTCLLMLESYQDQLDSITVTAPSYIYDILYGQNASTADIRKGETHTLRNLLYAMLLPSGNEAAYIVADYMGGGSVENFVSMMNAEAAAIGCTGTTFTDPCGLDVGNVTTAQDAYLILRAAIAYDAFVEVIGTTTYDMGTNDRYTTPGTYIIQNTDKMLVKNTDYYRSYTKGGKTGSLEDWQSFAGYHVQDGISYISVVLQSPVTEEDPRPALTETGTLMDWAYDAYEIAPALDTTQPITELPVVYSSEADTVMLYPADDMKTLLPKNSENPVTEKTFDLPERLTAPIQQGDVVGTVTLMIDDEIVGTVNLVAGSTLKRNEVLYTLECIKDFFSSTYFKVLVMLSMIVIAVYAALWVLLALAALNTKGKKRR